MSSKIPIGRKSAAQPSVPAQKRNNPQSSIPVLRRSNSQSSIHLRQSRSSVRGPSQGRVRTKSLALRSPFLNSNTLHPNYGSALVRARSTSNVKYTTPQRENRETAQLSTERKLRPLSSCSSGTKDLRPVNDKEWQRLQFTRVKSFLFELDSSLPSIKPLSISGFNAVMNLLLKQFDNRITITAENYKDEVIKYLKIFSYPGIIKPSLIKNISAPHEFPKVLAIWSWLIDRIEFIRNSDTVLRPARAIPDNIDLYHMLLSYNIQKFKLWNQDNEAGADESLRNELYAYYNIKSLNIEEKQKELEMLNAKAASLQDAKLKFNSEETERLQKENEGIKATNHEYLQRRETLAEANKAQKEEKLRQIEYVKKLIQIEEDNKRDVQDVLDAQKFDYLDSDNLSKKIQELNHAVKLNQDRIDAQVKSISSYDASNLATKLKAQEEIHRYNNHVSKLSLLNHKMNELKIRETGLTEPNFVDTLSATIKKKNKWMEGFEAELKVMQAKHVKISAENEEANLDIENETKELETKKLKVEDLKRQLDELNCAKKSEINKEQLHLDELNANFAVQKAEAEKNVEECKRKVQAAAAQLADTKDKMKRHCELSKEFFTHMANSIFQTIAKRKEQRQAIANAIVEASAGDVISEATAAALGIDLDTLKK